MGSEQLETGSSMTGAKWKSPIVAAGLALGLIAVGCTNSAGFDVADAGAPPTTSRSQATHVDPATVAPDDAGPLSDADGSWADLAVRGAVEAEYFSSIGDITSASSLVVVGHVVGLGPVRTIIGDAEGDVLSVPSLQVEIEEILAGQTHDPSIGIGGILTVESLRVPRKDDLPKESAVMFLMYKADIERNHMTLAEEVGKYRLISSQGLMRPSSDGIIEAPVFEAAYGNDTVGPLYEQHPLLARIRQMSSSELKAEVRRIGGE